MTMDDAVPTPGDGSPADPVGRARGASRPSGESLPTAAPVPRIPASMAGCETQGVPGGGFGIPARRIWAYAAEAPLAPFRRIELDWPPLPADEVEIEVESCGLCHSDLSMWRNAWGRTRYPLVPGHEIVGRVVAAGPATVGMRPGLRVGVGWYRGSCLACPACRAGDLNHCERLERLLIDGHGGFAERVRCHWAWAMPIPETIDPARAGPLFCAGITAYAPIARHVHPSHRVGVVGVGGIGHLAIRFLRASGCEVVAFVRDDAQADDARALGAHRVVRSDVGSRGYRATGPLDVILIATAARLPLERLVETLAPQGRLHWLGMACEPVALVPASLIGRALTWSGSPLGRPDELLRMMSFCARHAIAPVVERLPMSRIDRAFDRLAAGRARYRIVLEREA
jgi:uncharacterized zinc-type alcohol dehydrogenase-like protein